ncbi:MAG: helix-turn-helix transcriptional regulator [Candidatus Heimdallarchaeota archaeon]|nr:helix-turn-helix transcriptional regulator [Candidatus Heimdallarchaeota archaeon]
MMDSTSDSDINEVLKALNHEIRRSIIRKLHTTRESISYSDFLSELKLPASSNAAYHLVLLTKATVVEKDQDGKYMLTGLGERVALLLDVVVEPQSNAFTNLYMGFSRLNPLEILLGSWWIFFLLLGAIFVTENLFVGILSLTFALLSLGVLFYKVRTPWAILLVNNLLWILFAPERRIHLLIITLTNILGLIVLFPETKIVYDIHPIALIVGVLLILTSVILSVTYLIQVRRELAQS